jgi:hypothetical protein
MDHVPNPVQDLQRAIRNRRSQLARLFGVHNLVAVSRHDHNGYREAAILWVKPARVRDHSSAVQGARADLPWSEGHSRRELSLETFRHGTGCEERALRKGHCEPTEQRRNVLQECRAFDDAPAAQPLRSGIDTGLAGKVGCFWGAVSRSNELRAFRAPSVCRMEMPGEANVCDV